MKNRLVRQLEKYSSNCSNVVAKVLSEHATATTTTNNNNGNGNINNNKAIINNNKHRTNSNNSDIANGSAVSNKHSGSGTQWVVSVESFKEPPPPPKPGN